MLCAVDDNLVTAVVPGSTTQSGRAKALLGELRDATPGMYQTGSTSGDGARPNKHHDLDSWNATTMGVALFARVWEKFTALPKGTLRRRHLLPTQTWPLPNEAVWAEEVSLGAFVEQKLAWVTTEEEITALAKERAAEAATWVGNDPPRNRSDKRVTLHCDACLRERPNCHPFFSKRMTASTFV